MQFKALQMTEEFDAVQVNRYQVLYWLFYSLLPEICRSRTVYQRISSHSDGKVVLFEWWWYGSNWTVDCCSHCSCLVYALHFASSTTTRFVCCLWTQILLTFSLLHQHSHWMPWCGMIWFHKFNFFQHSHFNHIQ